jgi:hypothetical protein
VRSSTTPPKYCLAATNTPTGRGADPLACLHAAVAEAERVLGIDDLREDRGELELAAEATGEIIDIVPAPASAPRRPTASAGRVFGLSR